MALLRAGLILRNGRGRRRNLAFTAKSIDMEIREGKLLILQAFYQLAWARGRIEQSQADFIAELAGQMDLPLGSWMPSMVMGLTKPPKSAVTNLADIPIDDVERYQVVERFVALCLLGEGLSANQAEILANLALQLGIKAQELEEMRRRLC